MRHHGILIVDDEVVIAEELSEFLTSFDYPCKSAISVDAALELVNADTSITLVLTDMRMPGRDGAELIQILQGMPDREFEFVMISGHLDADEDLKHVDVQDVTLMRKPIDIEALIQFLEERDFETA